MDLLFCNQSRDDKYESGIQGENCINVLELFPWLCVLERLEDRNFCAQKYVLNRYVFVKRASDSKDMDGEKIGTLCFYWRSKHLNTVCKEGQHRSQFTQHNPGLHLTLSLSKISICTINYVLLFVEEEKKGIQFM